METITSRQNPLCVQVRKLAAEGKYRRRTGRFLCDSPKLVQEALRWTPEAVETVLCTSQALLPALPGHVRAVLVPEEVMASLAPLSVAVVAAIRKFGRIGADEYLA